MSRNSLALNSHSLRHPPTIVNSIRKIIRDTVKRLKHNDKYFNISIPSKDGNIILLKSDVMKLIRLLDIKYNGSFKTKNGIHKVNMVIICHKIRETLIFSLI